MKKLFLLMLLGIFSFSLNANESVKDIPDPTSDCEDFAFAAVGAYWFTGGTDGFEAGAIFDHIFGGCMERNNVY